MIRQSKKFISLVLILVMILVGYTVAFSTMVDAATPQDGTYSVSASLGGGSGRASITSASITVSGGKITARIVMSSENFTWIKVGGVTYNNQAGSGSNSTFSFPISALDTEIAASAQTTAMSQPHVVDYTITFSSSGVPMNSGGSSSSSSSSGSGSSSSSSSSGSGSSSGGSSSSNSSSADGTTDTTDEATTDEAREEQNGVTVDDKSITINNSYSKSTSVNEQALGKLEGKTLTISTSNGKIEFDKDTAAYITANAKGGITLTMDDVSKDKDYKDSEYDVVVKISLKDDEGNELYTDGKSGSASITLKYDNKVENKDNVKVYYIDSGKEEMKASYDSKAKTVTFDTKHFSSYAVTQASSSNQLFIVIAVVAVVIIAAAAGFFIVRRKRKA